VSTQKQVELITLNEILKEAKCVNNPPEKCFPIKQLYMDITLKLQFTFIYILSKTKVTNFT